MCTKCPGYYFRVIHTRLQVCAGCDELVILGTLSLSHFSQGHILTGVAQGRRCYDSSSGYQNRFYFRSKTVSLRDQIIVLFWIPYLQHETFVFTTVWDIRFFSNCCPGRWWLRLYRFTWTCSAATAGSTKGKKPSKFWRRIVAGGCCKRYGLSWPGGKQCKAATEGGRKPESDHIRPSYFARTSALVSGLSQKQRLICYCFSLAARRAGPSSPVLCWRKGERWLREAIWTNAFQRQ